MINQFTWLDIYLIGMVITFALALIVNHRRKLNETDPIHILVMASLLWPITIFIGSVDLIVNSCFIWSSRR